MNSIHALAILPLAAALLTLQPSEANACGGCFVPPGESTQVTGHRMVMSIGMTQSTLYDQILYTGLPASFAWVLPIKGKVDVGLSSDLIFNQLGLDTSVTVSPPPLNCPVYNCTNSSFTDDANGGTAASSGAGGGADNGVDVIAQEVVGPYEMVQLAAQDPNALKDWLDAHGFNIPADIQPIVASYVNQGFNFLALKLVPGVGIDRIQPVRITTQGANVALPLQMVAAGTGALTTMTLWVLGNGRYETANRPNITIPVAAHMWNYDEQRSNRSELIQQAYDATNGFGWLTESARTYSESNFRSQIMNVVEMLPEQSGYSDDYEEAVQLAQEDLDALFAGLNGNVWVTRLRAEASRESLGTDLSLAASDEQVETVRSIQCEKFIGTQPACPPPPPGCYEDDGSSPGDFNGGSSSAGSGGCSVGSHGFGSSLVGSMIFLAFLRIQRRRRRKN